VPLPPEYRDYELVGEWAGFRECHIGGDFPIDLRSPSGRFRYLRARRNACGSLRIGDHLNLA
jgi:mRNA interferase YafQ